MKLMWLGEWVRGRVKRLHLAALCSLAGTLPFSAAAQSSSAQADFPGDLATLTIEELSRVTVTSVSRRPEPLSEAPAAIYVIRRDEILRSPATSLPELLSAAPNLQSQRINAHEFAISARGFNGYDSSNKLLALIDGRSIYTPLFSGVLWELHSPLLEDINQIEVISGPGGTLYGPNAVNGVINVTTRDARDTLGGLVRTTAAANERTAAARYGVPLGTDGAVRAYVNYVDREEFPAGTGRIIDDRLRGVQGGFRADIGAGTSHFTLQGDVFDNDGQAGDRARGHNILARWTAPVGPGVLQTQAYYDSFKREVSLVRDELTTLDFSSQYSFDHGAHQAVAGVGLRTTDDLYINNFEPFRLEPDSKRLWILNVFAQDRFALSAKMSIIAGLKVEQSSFSGLELLPNVRLTYQANDTTFLWAAASRAVRTPSRVDRQLSWRPLLLPASEFQSETLIAFEAGYRGQPTRRTSVSVSVFYNLYDDIRTTESVNTSAVFPIILENGLNVRTYGIEAWATQQITPAWRLRLGLSTLGKSLRLDTGHIDLTGGRYAGNDPDYTVEVWSELDLPRATRLDLGLRARDDLENPHVAGFIEAQARLGMLLSEQVELFVSGMNILRGVRLESGEPRAQLVERSVRFGTRLRF